MGVDFEITNDVILFIDFRHKRDEHSVVVVTEGSHIPAGIEHVGHERDGVDTAGCVHHVDDHTGER